MNCENLAVYIVWAIAVGLFSGAAVGFMACALLVVSKRSMGDEDDREG